jgi:hypothetical protein
MQTLQIDKNNARKLYPTAAPEFKTMLEDSFGKDFFSQKITDRIKTFEDACEILGLDPNHNYYRIGPADEIAYTKLKVIIQALNEGWTPNWNDSNERKWRPWFYLNAPGFRLYGVYCNITYSAVGSRLCLRSEELAEYAAKQFLDLYKDFFTA